MSGWPEEAMAAHAAAGACIDERRFVDAIPHAERATELAPTWDAPWSNLTVAYKHARRWKDVLTAHERVLALDPDGDNQGAHWNAGIAATALRDWKRARAAWRAAGLEIEEGDRPIDYPCGTTPVRVALDDEPEVIWTDRIDPCRAVILSVPLPDSDRRYGDLLLHDGEPRGKRQLGDRMVSVFDELDLLERSSYGTWEVIVNAGSEDEVEALTRLFEGTDVGVEDWTGSVRLLCSRCSLGEPHEHDGEPAPTWAPRRRLGIAARSENDLRPLRRLGLWWRRDIVSVQRVL
jgi:hypothetical protein